MSDRPFLSAADRLEIFDLYARQSHAIDGGEAQAWAFTFTPEGRFESPTFQLTATGHRELTDFAKNSNNLALGRGEQLRHWTNSLVLDALGPDDVQARGYLLIIAVSAGQSRIDRSLVIADRLTRTPAGWRLVSRVVIRDDPVLPGGRVH